MRLSGPGAKTVKLTVTEEREVALDQIVLVDALDWFADEVTLGIQSRVTLRDGTKLLCTNSPSELSQAFLLAYPRLLLGHLKGGGVEPNWNQSDV